MKISLKYKLTAIQLILLLFMSSMGSIFTVLSMQKYFQSRLTHFIKSQLSQVTLLLQHPKITDHSISSTYQYLGEFARAAGYRLTLIDSSGTVQFDSDVKMDSLKFLDNHLNRPEIIQAQKQGFGFQQRFSTTLNMPYYYAARELPPSFPEPSFQIKYIRIAYPLSFIEQQFNDLRIKILLANALGLVLIGTFSFWLANRLSSPIQKMATVAAKVEHGDLQAHFQPHSHDEIGQLAELLNKMLDKLRDDLVQMRKLEQVRTQFLGNVSHELRTPIFTLQGYLETLLNNAFPDPTLQKDFLMKAYQQSVRLNNLLTDLIDISRIESGEMKMIFRPFDVYKLLAKQVEEMQNKAKEYNVSIKLENTPPDHIVYAIGDVDRITQVLLNLIDNAIKYNLPNGKVMVGYIESAHHVEIYVQDTGRGIAEEHLPRIFERFYRVDKERSRAVGGTGLGLAIVKHIVEAHGSQMVVQSTLNQGSRFSFLLRKSTNQ